MSEADFYAPTDADALRMENELLAFEVRFLRAHLGLGTSKTAGSLASPARLAYLEEAERDLVLLVRRISSLPVAPALLRASRSLRTLQQRYLGPSAGAEGRPLPERVAYLEGAEKDLVLLLRRMGRPPFGRAFRLKGEFRTLEQRYL